LKALARVSRLLRDRATCQKLRGAANADALYALLTERPGPTPPDAGPHALTSVRLVDADRIEIVLPHHHKGYVAVCDYRHLRAVRRVDRIRAAPSIITGLT